jgi:glutaryl-CoA dehydrogenase
MTLFAGVDCLGIDNLLTEEELLVRRTARQFVGDRVLPIIEEHNRQATFNLHLFSED